MSSDRTSPRVALVTGAGSGLGRATADELRSAGWKVAGLDLAATETDLALVADVSNSDAVKSSVDQILDTFGRLDGVAHCAGVVRNTLTPFHELDDETWNITIGVNLTGSFNVTRATLPLLVASQGALVLVASTSARHPQPGGTAYAASKAGVRALVEAVALEYAPHGVRACSVSPGYMQTGMTAQVLSRSELRDSIEAAIPLGRIADPAEVGSVIAFLLGDGARFMTGQDVMVDGGRALTAYATPTDVAAMWERHERRSGNATVR